MRSQWPGGASRSQPVPRPAVCQLDGRRFVVQGLDHRHRRLLAPHDARLTLKPRDLLAQLATRGNHLIDIGLVPGLDVGQAIFQVRRFFLDPRKLVFQFQQLAGWGFAPSCPSDTEQATNPPIRQITIRMLVGDRRDVGIDLFPATLRVASDRWHWLGGSAPTFRTDLPRIGSTLFISLPRAQS